MRDYRRHLIDDSLGASMLFAKTGLDRAKTLLGNVQELMPHGSICIHGKRVEGANVVTRQAAEGR